MVKKSGLVLFGIFMGFLSIVVGKPSSTNSKSNSILFVTGNSIKDVLGGFYESTSINQRIFILSQIILLVVVVVVVFVVVKKFRSKNKISKQNYIVKVNNKRSRTDIDTLYEMLKRRKEIGIEDTERVFRINSDVALGWYKILENGSLAEINYPRFGKPVLRLIEEKEVGEDKGMGKHVDVVKKDVIKPKHISKNKNVKEKFGGRSSKEKIIKKKLGLSSFFSKKNKGKKEILKNGIVKKKGGLSKFLSKKGKVKKEVQKKAPKKKVDRKAVKKKGGLSKFFNRKNKVKKISKKEVVWPKLVPEKTIKKKSA